MRRERERGRNKRKEKNDWEKNHTSALVGRVTCDVFDGKLTPVDASRGCLIKVDVGRLERYRLVLLVDHDMCIKGLLAIEGVGRDKRLRVISGLSQTHTKESKEKGDDKDSHCSNNRQLMRESRRIQKDRNILFLLFLFSFFFRKTKENHKKSGGGR